MKNLLHTKNLPILTAVLGLLGCALRWALYTMAVDEKNLIPLWHPLEIVLWLVTAAAVVLTVTKVWQLRNADCKADRFRPSVPAAVGSFCAAVGIGLTVLLAEPGFGSTLGTVWKIAGVLAFASLDVIAKYRWKGKEPFFLLHTVVCVFFAVHMVSCYRTWSSNPQLMDYVFTLFASAGLMLFAFYHGCLEAGMGKLRMLPGVGLLTAYCCIVALSGTDYMVLYLSGAVWCLTNLCRLHTGE